MNARFPEALSPQALPDFDAQFFTQIVETMNDPVFVKDEQHRWVFLNEAFCKFIGLRKEELLGKSDYEFFPADEADVFWEKDDLVFASGKPNVNIEKITNSDHKLSIISTQKSIITDSYGNRFLLGIIRDVTDAMRREGLQAQIARILKHLILGASKEKILHIILQVAEEELPAVTASLLRLDPETRRLSPAVRSRLPEEFSDAINGTPARAGMGSCGEAAFSGAQVIAADIATHPNWKLVRNLALKHELRACWSQPVFNFGGEVAATFALYLPYAAEPSPFEKEVLTTLAQLTTVALEHHRIVEETGELKRLLSAMIDAMPSILIAVNQNGEVLQWNAEAESRTGVTACEALGCPIESVLPLNAKQMTDLSEAIDNRRTLFWQRLNTLWDAEEGWFDLALYPLDSDRQKGSVIRIDDVSKQVRLQQIMMEAEKINSLGGLTAGMAHEINNPLAGILQNVQILQNRMKKGNPINNQVAAECGITLDQIENYMLRRSIFEIVDHIQSAGQRAGDIVRNMLNFCRKNEMDISRAQHLLAWEPRHRLLDTLPAMIARLKADPEKWYRENGLEK